MGARAPCGEISTLVSTVEFRQSHSPLRSSKEQHRRVTNKQPSRCKDERERSGRRKRPLLTRFPVVSSFLKQRFFHVVVTLRFPFLSPFSEHRGLDSLTNGILTALVSPKGYLRFGSAPGRRPAWLAARFHFSSKPEDLVVCQSSS